MYGKKERSGHSLAALSLYWIVNGSAAFVWNMLVKDDEHPQDSVSVIKGGRDDSFVVIVIMLLDGGKGFVR